LYYGISPEKVGKLVQLARSMLKYLPVKKTKTAHKHQQMSTV